MRANRTTLTKMTLVAWTVMGVVFLTACTPDAPTPQGSAQATATVKNQPTPPAASPKSSDSPPKKLKKSVRKEKEPLVNSPEFATSPDKLKKGVLERPDAARMVVSLIKDSVDYGPTLIVWVIDRSVSSRELLSDSARLISSLSGDIESINKESTSPEEARLLMAVCSFGEDVKFEVDPPSANPDSLADAVSSLAEDASGKEVTFAAIQQSLEKYLPYRTEKQREVVFVVISDEAGDDAELLDKFINEPKRAGVPFYVIGVPAPFGREAALSPTVEMGFDYKPSANWLAIRQGPESRKLEVLRIGSEGPDMDLSLMDSGFGPFALERLCRATGGKYLALRPDTSEFSFISAINTQWPTPGMTTFDPEVMRRYTPDYVSAQEYENLLTNKARRAVVEAAQLPELPAIHFSQTTFTKTDEAQMVRMLNQAQQLPAQLLPIVDNLYATLEKGEADRAKLTDPRWQANFDLAMGIAAAAKARVDGYNNMLATLKRGKTFQVPNSTTWVIEPADTIEGASALQKLIDKSKASLQRVVDQHPGTPWAKIAERHLQSPAGWKWAER